MKLKKWLTATSILSILPLTAISCIKVNKEKIDKLNDIINLQDEKLATKETEINQLKKALEAINKEKEVISQKINSASNIATNLWNSFSANKDVTTKQAYENAKRIFDIMLKQEGIDTKLVDTTKEKVTLRAENDKFIPVVFMDLDDTVLNNFKVQNYFALNTGFDFNTFEEYIKDASSDEVLGSIEFIKYVWSKGGIVMFNSNRLQKTSVDGSRRNLIKLGLEEKYAPDWVFWMKGVDLNSPMPWKNTSGGNNKEERMNAVNTNEWEIDGVKAKFRTIMRIGDDINDFNDNFTKNNNAQSIKAEVKDKPFGKLFGNSNLENKSIYFNPTTKSWETKNWSESYIFISGNASYGGWIKQLGFKNHAYSAQEGFDKLNEYLWVPKAKNKI
ncbi:HAD family acid phosphatase [Mycoplasma sp. M5725]|uniref:HAD family acid phosphatase n=1 Tax=Mycoplasma phocimorsus TaxID=3045839 RepID=A0AAJ1PT52_9MOLU|nr:HAD family acid phosphatase [Mycoplasma phocimorsus]MDJ1645727.1 HAD family acid phosphatase [Mycoplasma phocimorsus]